MWCIAAKAKKDIPLSEEQDIVENWDNKRLRNFIATYSLGCSEFNKALEWLGDRNYKEAVRDCTKSSWLNWLSSRIPPDKHKVIIKEGERITITNGRNERYALWHGSGIWDLSEEYVGETITIISIG